MPSLNCSVLNCATLRSPWNFSSRLSSCNTITEQMSQAFNMWLSPNLKGRIPLVLSCGHSICQTCLQSVLKFAEPIICKDCAHHHTISPTDIKQLVLDENLLRTVFPINMFLLGVLTQQHTLESANQMPLAPNRIKFTNKAPEPKESFLQSESGLPCAECNLSATCTCNQCNTLLCYICFDRIHSAYNSLKSHVKQPLALAAASKTMTCSSHIEKFLEFFCADCDKSVCVNCMITNKSCNEHNVRPIQEKNAECVADLKKVREEANDIYLRLGDTVSVLLSLKGESQGVEICEWNIDKHFAQMHALLQLKRMKLMNTLEEIREQEVSAWQDARRNAINNINIARDFIKAADFAMVESNFSKVNIPVLIKQLEDVKNMPWYISKEEQIKSPILHVNENIYEELENHVKVEGDACTVYNLVATKDIKEGVEIPPQPIKPAFKSSVNQLLPDETKVGKKTKQSRPTAALQAPSASPTPRPLLEGSHEYMYITHINSPHDFFLQRVIHQPKQMSMIKEFAKPTSMSVPHSNQVVEDKMFLGFNELEKKWHRCRILSAERRDEAKPVFKVFYVDFGLTDTLTLNKLRVLSTQRSQEPALALHACLANCRPLNSTGAWAHEDNMLMQQIINNKQVVALVTKSLGATQFGLSLECDVTTADTAVNLVDALVFHERAQYTHPRVQFDYVKQTLPRYFVNTDLKVGDNEDVIVTFVRNPDDFYVRKMRLQEQYSKMTDQLNKTYSNSKDCVYMPEIGMPVVCNVSNYSGSWGKGAKEAGWRRALVLGVQAGRRVHVQLVDCGRDLLVHWSTLRRLEERFTHITTLAIQCHLYGITPVGKWSNEVKSRFTLMCNKILNMEVEESTDRNQKSVAVILRDIETPETTINDYFTQHKCAIPENSNNFKKITKPQTTKATVKILRKDRNIKETQPFHSPQTEDIEPSKYPLKLEVKILSCESPACMYVSLVDQQENLSKMFQQMQQYYSDIRLPALSVVKVYDRVAVFSSRFKKWHRAVVEKSDVENSKVKVFLKDMALSEEVELGKLKSLPEKFLKVPEGTIKCHLSGIAPAIGDQWPIVTNNYLDELTNEHERFYISKHGNISNNSLPIQLWVYSTTAGDALEPNVCQWLNINDKIVEQGLALVIKADPDEQTETLGEVSTFPIEDWFKQADTNDWGETQPWQSASDLQEKMFIAICTELNNEFIIYLHNVCQVQTLDEITAALDEQFQNSVPNPLEQNWCVAQPCIVKYDVDKKYHRGTVLAVKKNSCTVLFVDYGTVNDCAFEDMRKKKQLAEICYTPIQAVQCQITSIKPMEGKWSESILEYIRTQIISKESLVTVIGEKNNDVYPIEIKIGQVVISDLLVSKQIAYYAQRPVYSFTEELICNDDNDETSTESYELEEVDELDPINEDWSKQVEEELGPICISGDLLLYPNPVLPSRTFTCTITVFLNETDMLLHLISDEARVSNEFSSITVEMQEEGNRRPALDGVYEHKACIALFSGDDHWYRAKVLQYDEVEKMIKVEYVDYGNKEILSADKVRESKPSWCKLEAQAIAASLHGVQRGPGEQSVLLQRYTEFLERPLQATVLQAQAGCLQVQLHEEGSQRLLYQDLIDDGSLVATH